eukprot:8569111-Alexandrium_andersonii.AAC.1
MGIAGRPASSVMWHAPLLLCQLVATRACSVGAAARARGITGAVGYWPLGDRCTHHGHLKRTLMPMGDVGMPVCVSHAQASHLGVT